ncbi:MAG: NADP-dependent phosphogluconate dehydrogenase [SAR324 cluster bacterium]|nr:NADP-dependent phosphogluconate dehydrogenase [SAR324 cluster bacterium]
MDKYNVAMIGLGVMGSNLLLNLERNGFSGVGFDINKDSVERFLAGPAQGKKIMGTTDWKEVAANLEKPRKVFMLVPAGGPVDAALDELSKVLEPGDVIVESGNSYYKDTNRREEALGAKGFHFTGMGVSGGEEGALNGPSMMPGGPRKGYDNLAPSLEKIAAQVEDGPCVTYCGPQGAGHYVKMVHNGIEYGDMQLIAEAYDLLHRLGGLSHTELADVFAEWNQGELESFLIEIAERVLRQGDDEGSGDLLDVIKDSASMKGTGKWTVQDALDQGVAIPTITAAVDARLVSAVYEERQHASRVLSGPPAADLGMDRKTLIDSVRAALYCSKTCSYAQGMSLLRQASMERDWNLPFGEIARIWKAGCIIRAVFLKTIQEAYKREPELTNLLLDPFFNEAIATRQQAWRDVVTLGVKAGIPLPAMGASLAYYDAYRAKRLPANLVQGLRDLFGAHTYERLDRDGSFHTQWGGSGANG